MGGRLEGIERGLGLQRRDIRDREIETGELGHRIRCILVNRTNQHPNSAHTVLPMSSSTGMLRQRYGRGGVQERVATLNLTQRLCALTLLAVAFRVRACLLARVELKPLEQVGATAR